MGTVGNIKRDLKKALNNGHSNKVNALSNELKNLDKKDGYINKAKH